MKEIIAEISYPIFEGVIRQPVIDCEVQGAVIVTQFSAEQLDYLYSHGHSIEQVEGLQALLNTFALGADLQVLDGRVDGLEGLLDTLTTAVNAHFADTAIHVNNTQIANWDSKAAGNHNHSTLYFTKQEILDALSLKSNTSHNHTLASLSERSYNSLTGKPDLSSLHAHNNIALLNTIVSANIHTHSNKTVLDYLTNTGDGTKYLADNGTYKTITSGGTWGSITGTLSAQTDLATALNSKALQSDLTTTNGNVSSLSTTVSNIQTNLDTAETNITALQTNKADKTEIPTVPTALSSFTKDINFDERYYTETEIDSALSGKAPLSHSQAISTVTGLQTALDGKAPTTHYHTLAGLTEKSYNSLTDKPTIPTVPTVLSAFTNDLTVYYLKAETYSKTETNGLLSGKAASTHNHDTAYEAKNTNIQTHISSTAVHLTTTEKTNVGKLISNGNGLSFLANDGTYKSVSISFASLTGNPTDNTAIATALSGKAPLSHTHSISNVTDLQTTLDSKAASTHNHTLAGLSEKSYSSLTDKPTIPIVPTALSGFTNDLTAYYLKTETYTQTDINSYLSAKMKAHAIASGTQTSLTLDLATNNIFNIELSANASFSISNPETTRDYYFYVKNTGASAITITLPNTADIVASATVSITAAKTRAFAMQWNGTKRIWQVSEEIA